MSDFLDTLAFDAKTTVESGYYQTPLTAKHEPLSLNRAIQQCTANAVITEIKAASPSLGTIRATFDPKKIAQTMQKAGAVGISVLTEPKHFNGSLGTLVSARNAVDVPILMKDIVIVPEQIDVAAKIGANAVLLIQALFDRDYCEMDKDKMVAYAHAKGLEVLLETHTVDEFESALQTEADLVGINNRNLATLKIDLNTTKKILEKHKNHGRTIISESGITTPKDLQFLRSVGASAFLVGSSIMLADNMEEKVREFVGA
jgi:indole-3-glycerol phosphate synthase